MKFIGLALILLVAILVTGCSRNRKSQTEPMTLEAWQALPAENKYAVGTLERLKSDNAKFANEREWDQFMKNVLIPGRKKELPNGMASK